MIIWIIIIEKEEDNYEYDFNVTEQLNKCIEWTKNWFNTNLPGHKAVLGMSGGKDSTVAAAIIAKALGPENVIGVAMPDTNQGLMMLIRFVNIWVLHTCMPKLVITRFNRCGDDEDFMVKQTKTNIPPRVRMTMLYAVAQTYNGVIKYM